MEYGAHVNSIDSIINFMGKVVYLESVSIYISVVRTIRHKLMGNLVFVYKWNLETLYELAAHLTKTSTDINSHLDYSTASSCNIILFLGKPY